MLNMHFFVVQLVFPQIGLSKKWYSESLVLICSCRFNSSSACVPAFCTVYSYSVGSLRSSENGFRCAVARPVPSKRPWCGLYYDEEKFDKRRRHWCRKPHLVTCQQSMLLPPDSRVALRAVALLHSSPALSYRIHVPVGTLEPMTLAEIHGFHDHHPLFRGQARQPTLLPNLVERLLDVCHLVVAQSSSWWQIGRQLV